MVAHDALGRHKSCSTYSRITSMGEEEKRILNMLADGSITDAEPFFIDVDDEDEKVQIYVG